MGIFFFVLSEAWPLFRSPEVTAEKTQQVAGPFAIGLDPYYQTAYAVGPQGVDLLRLDDGQVFRRERPAELTGREVTAAQRMPNDVLALGTDDGHLLVARIRFQLDYSSGQRQVVTQFAVERLIAVDPAGESLVQVAFREGDDGRSVAAAITASGRLVVMVAEQQQGLLGPGERQARQYELTADFDDSTTRLSSPKSELAEVGKATQVLLDGRIRQLLVGTIKGGCTNGGWAGWSKRRRLSGTLPSQRSRSQRWGTRWARFRWSSATRLATSALGLRSRKIGSARIAKFTPLFPMPQPLPTLSPLRATSSSSQPTPRGP